MLPFDGGHAVVVVYEGIMSKVRGRRVMVDYRKLIPVSAVVVIFLMVISLSAMFLDIQRSGSSGLRAPVGQYGVMERRVTRQIHVGGVAVGGGAPVSVQSMTTTKTADVDGTLAQIYSLAAAGCDIVRCTCNEEAAAVGLSEIVPRSPVPIIADIHFQYKLALAAMEAGVQGLRLNPGNIRKPEHIKLVAAEARDRGLPIRIGVNAGSLDPDIAEAHGGATPEALVASAERELAYFAEVGFDDVKISVKSSNVPVMIDSYRLLSETVDFPLHLGVTEAGPVAGRLAEGHRGHRDAAVGGHRRHHPLLAHRRPGRRGQGRPSAARGARAARAQGPRPASRARRAAAPRSTSSRWRAKRRTRSRRATSRCRSR